MNKKDLIASVVFLVIAVSLFTYASTFPVKEGAIPALSAGFYPRFLAVILAVLSLVMMVQSFRKKAPPEDCPVPDTEPFYKTRGGLNLLLTIAMLVAYPFILEHLGFASAAFVFIFVMIILLTDDASKKLSLILILSLILTVVMYCIFKLFLGIPFPRGILI